MYVTFEHRDCMAEETQDLIQCRVRRAVHGLAVALVGVHVHVSNSIKFPFVREKRCWVELTLSDSSVIIGAAQAFAWRSAIDLAMARACRSLSDISRVQEPVHASPAGRSRNRW